MIASYVIEFTEVGEVWFIVSPRNPLKETSTLLPGVNRLYMVNVAVEDEPAFKASNIEFHLPEPSYTIDTMDHLREQHPDRDFRLIAGADILPELRQWKEYERLLDLYSFFIYPRFSTAPTPFDQHPSIQWIPAPFIGISSSFIRIAIRDGKNMRHFLPEKVWRYIDEMGFYR